MDLETNESIAFECGAGVAFSEVHNREKRNEREKIRKRRLRMSFPFGYPYNSGSYTKDIFGRLKHLYNKSYADFFAGRTFKVVEVGDVPPGERLHCALCGGRIKHFVLVQRDDGDKAYVGRGCLEGWLGLELPKKVKKSNE